MINAEIVLDYRLWKKKIKNPKTYFKKKLNKLSKFTNSKKRSKNFTILLTNNNKMRYLNNKFRNKNKITDVLSFPFLEKIKNKNLYLGDIAISYQFVNNRSKSSNFELEFDKMWVHGYLHLLGYDHKKNKDYYKMNKIEDKILKYFHKLN
tara:strand:+ start:222 stop:671 length:450 start_codon:yes stop_codon:yes gene_type:complete